MRTNEEAYDAAKDEPAFSNGTEGYEWMGNWCEECVHDSPELVDEGEGCPLILVAMMGRTPVEWIEQDQDSLGDRYHCTEYREAGGDDDDPPPPRPPRPEPENPDQLTIFGEFAEQAVEQFQAIEPAVANG